MLSKEYIAGFIDGEGYLGIMKMNNPKPRFVVAIKICQVSDQNAVLYEIQKQYGGRIEFRKFKQPTQRDATALCFLNNPEIRNVLKDIKDLLIVKKKQCEILEEFVNLPKGKAASPLMVNRKSLEDKILFNKELFDKKEQLYLKIRKLNKVGN